LTFLDFHSMASQTKRPMPARSAGETSAPGAAPAASATEMTAPEARSAPPRRPGEGLNITTLKDMSIQKLTQIAKDMAIAGATGMRKQDLIFQILKAQTEQSGFIFSEGVLEV